jgi:hypothetical protein
MEKRRKESRIKVVRRQKSAVDKGADTKKYCGTLAIKEDPMAIQKRLRNEWQ